MSTPRHNGFTLIELLVVLLVMGLVLSMAPTAFHRVMPGLALKAAAREVAAVFREARSVAIRDNRETAVIVDTQAKAYRLDGARPDHALDPAFGVTLVAAASERLGESAGRIRFFPDGTSTGGRLSLTRNERTYHIVVDWLTGRVDVVR
ncbi:MAG: GspH/FimT family protein [Kiloniellaceae bacterium]